MLRTDDLFLDGLALTRGGELVGVDVRGQNGRRVAIFAIAGPEVEQAERDYYRGTTAVDLQLLKLQVRRLKDKAFDALRQERPQAGRHTARAGWTPARAETRRGARPRTRASAPQAPLEARRRGAGMSKKGDGRPSRNAAAGAEDRAVSERRVTVSSLYRPSLELPGDVRSVPFVRLTGRWLESVGFAIGGKVRVEVARRRLVLTPLPASEGAPCR